MVGSETSDISDAGSIPVISSVAAVNPDCPTLRQVLEPFRGKFQTCAISATFLPSGPGSTLSHFCCSFLLRMQRAEEALTRNLLAALGAKRSLSGRSDRREGGFTVR